MPKSLVKRMLEPVFEPFSYHVWNFFTKLERRYWRVFGAQLRRRLKRCGDDVIFHGRVWMTGEENVEIGNNVNIGENAEIRGEGGLTIGDNGHFSRNLVVYTINHNYRGTLIPYDETFIPRPVTIGPNVWIGINVTVLPGAEIGEGAIIGAGSVVRGNVPPLAVVGPQGTVTLKHRDGDHYRSLVEQGLISGRGGEPYVPGTEK